MFEKKMRDSKEKEDSYGRNEALGGENKTNLKKDISDQNQPVYFRPAGRIFKYRFPAAICLILLIAIHNFIDYRNTAKQEKINRAQGHEEALSKGCSDPRVQEVIDRAMAELNGLGARGLTLTCSPP